MKKISAGIAVLALAGCVSNDTPVNAKPTAASTADRNLVAATIAQNLKDPESAQFRNWRAYQLSNGHRVICAELNAKNGFGGYVGFEPAYARLSGSRVLTAQHGDGAALACSQAAQNTLKIASALG